MKTLETTSSSSAEKKESALKILKQYQSTKDEGERKALGDAFLSIYYDDLRIFVLHLTHHLSQKQSLRDDLFQEACITFIHLMDSFRVDSGYSFLTYALPEVRRTVQTMQDVIELGIPLWQARNLKKVKQEFSNQSQSGIVVQDFELLRENNETTSFRTHQTYFDIYCSAGNISIDELTSEENLGFMNRDEMQQVYNPENIVIQKLFRNDLLTCLEELLEPDEFRVLIEITGTGCDKKNAKQVAEEFCQEGRELSPQNVRSIYDKAIKRCRSSEKLKQLL